MGWIAGFSSKTPGDGATPVPTNVALILLDADTTVGDSQASADPISQ